MLEHIRTHNAPYLDGKSDNLLKQIYDLNVVHGEYLASFINRGSLIHNNILLSIKYVSLNLLFEQVLTQIIT